MAPKQKRRRFSGRNTTIESLPDDLLHCILSTLSGNPRDVAACSCVSRRWRSAAASLPSLTFGHDIFDDFLRPRTAADAAIGRMVAAASSLRHLAILCPVSAPRIASWLALIARSLRALELRFNTLAAGELDCISLAKGLESLKLESTSLMRPPNWGSGTFQNLRIFEIEDSIVPGETFSAVLRACPHLTDLSLLRCYGDGAISIESEQLERCSLDIHFPGHSSLHLHSPRLQHLHVQGFNQIRVGHDHRIKRLFIANCIGCVTMLDVGKLPELELMAIRGQQWRLNVINYVLQLAVEVKHLAMNIECCGDIHEPEAFQTIHMEEFFDNHSKLHGVGDSWSNLRGIVLR